MPTRLIMKTTIESSGRMHSPAHPGEFLRGMYRVPWGVRVTKVAEALGVTGKHFSHFRHRATQRHHVHLPQDLSGMSWTVHSSRALNGSLHNQPRRHDRSRT